MTAQRKPTSLLQLLIAGIGSVIGLFILGFAVGVAVVAVSEGYQLARLLGSFLP